MSREGHFLGKTRMNIALIYDNVKHQNETAIVLDEAGFTVNLSFSTDAPWFDAVRKDKPDVVVISVAKPDGLILQQLKMFKQEVICPVVVIANEAEADITESVILSGADTCITGDLYAGRIQSIIQVNLARFKVTRELIQEIQDLNKNIDSLESRLSDRKDIEKAKGLLMTSYRMNENDAYNAMRRMAMDTGNKLGEVARNLISMSKVLN